MFEIQKVFANYRFEQKFFEVLFQGEYYNQDEVQAMVAAEVLEEEKKKKIEEEEMKEEIEAVEEQKKRKRRGPLVAA